MAHPLQSALLVIESRYAVTELHFLSLKINKLQP